ncbi:hypothetical protein SJ268_24515, partial [Escherichia coli]
TVLHCDLRRHRPGGAAAVELSREMTPGWSRDGKRISGWSDDEQAVFTDMIASIVLPKAFASVTMDGRIIAKAYGAISNGLLVLESVATDADYRK